MLWLLFLSSVELARNQFACLFRSGVGGFSQLRRFRPVFRSPLSHASEN
jgi:hypothetical protein